MNKDILKKIYKNEVNYDEDWRRKGAVMIWRSVCDKEKLKQRLANDYNDLSKEELKVLTDALLFTEERSFGFYDIEKFLAVNLNIEKF